LDFLVARQRQRQFLANLNEPTRTRSTAKSRQPDSIGLPDMISVEACYLGRQDSRQNLAILVEPDINP